MTQNDWAQRLTAAIGANIKRARTGRMSAQVLANRCAELGHAIQRDVISNLENGRRGTIPVTDLMVIAEALDVPASSLVFNPDAAGEMMERTPAVEALVWETFEQFAGLRTERHIGEPAFDTWHKMYSLRTLADYEAAALEHSADADSIRESSAQEAALDRTSIAADAIRQRLKNRGRSLPTQDDSDRELIESYERKAITALRVVYRERGDLNAMGVKLWPLPESLTSRYARVEMEAEEGQRK